MKEFNLTEYLKDPSQKVVTRDGREVRIVCTDFKNEQPILALVTKGNREDIHFYYQNGVWCNEFPENKSDLFFAPIKREGWINVYKGVIENHLPFVGQKVYKSKEDAIRNKCEGIYLTTIKIEWEE